VTKTNCEVLNLLLVEGSSVRPCIALHWVQQACLLGFPVQYQAQTHLFEAALVPWAAGGHVAYIWAEITEQRLQQKLRLIQSPETP
jgi:hypothetical protein